MSRCISRRSTSPAGGTTVIYMHDGQNLFDPAASFAGEWRVDDTLERLAPQGIEAIVVAVPNMGTERIDEYSPFRDPARGGGRGDAYVDFLARTLKPEVDRLFRTRRERSHTGIMGSSMGALISLYAFFREAPVFAAIHARVQSKGQSRHAARFD